MLPLKRGEGVLHYSFNCTPAALVFFIKCITLTLWRAAPRPPPILVALMVASRYALPGYGKWKDQGSKPSRAGLLVSGLWRRIL